MSGPNYRDRGFVHWTLVVSGFCLGLALGMHMWRLKYERECVTLQENAGDLQKAERER